MKRRALRAINPKAVCTDSEYTDPDYNVSPRDLPMVKEKY